MLELYQNILFNQRVVMANECPSPPSSWALAFDGPYSFVVIIGGIIGNVYSLKQLFSRSINTSMLVSLTGLAIWDIVSFSALLSIPFTCYSGTFDRCSMASFTVGNYALLLTTRRAVGC